MTKAVEVRRRAVRLLGVLAAALLVAGVLPWVTGGELTIRLLALPMFLAGLMVAGAALRVHSLGPKAAEPPARAGCDGCMCGQNTGCDTAEALGKTSAVG